MPINYEENFIEEIVFNSISDNWEEASKEWKIINCLEDYSGSEQCVCGRNEIKYSYTIKNKYNGNIIYPIGGACIRKFKTKEIEEEIVFSESLFKLLHAVEDGENILLTSKYFSEELLHILYIKGAFPANVHNDFSPYKDFGFMIRMFRVKDKKVITHSQQDKINYIIDEFIVPFLETELEKRDMGIEEI